ncbi:hypothetical protein [Dactylosporangium sp. NPDC049140]|uniref:hypothetical protein n=1 Tax=Dactylosporangium sp. NPDC049140 TaxID=3155647 RepID=UPI0034041F0B
MVPALLRSFVQRDLMRFTQGRGVVLAPQDVTAQRSFEEHLHKAAYFDTRCWPA